MRNNERKSSEYLLNQNAKRILFIHVDRLKFFGFGIGLSFLLSFGCGLFYKGVPKPGEFCYVLSKPPQCLYVDFDGKKLIWDEVEYSLEEKLRMDYFFHKDGDIYELTVSTVNRVEIQNVSKSNFHQFYMRKKEKFTEIPKGSSTNETKH